MKHPRPIWILAAAAMGFAACATGNTLGTGATSGGGAGTNGTGGAAAACPPCLQNSNCASGSDCAQFSGDQFCAPDCSSAPCADDRTCTSTPGADGHTYQVCIPNTNVCGGPPATSAGGSTPTATSTSATSTSSTSASSGGGTCSHSPCSTGAALTTGCSSCATTVCAGDSYCCDDKWDSQCVTEAMSACGPSCGGGSTSSSSSASSTSSSTSTSTSASSSTGGPVSELSFAIVGDTRPPNEDDTAGYPTAVITKIYQDVEAASPRPSFVVTTGDYQFASPSHTPGTQAAQLADYMGARNLFSGVVYPTMGNHECDGATADNCAPCTACSNVGGTCSNGVCLTPNYNQFASNLLTPVGQTQPYYTINVNGTNNAWTAKFVFIACNMWTPAQATWLDSALSTSTTYTFVVRHESPGTSGAPCVTASPSADSITTSHPFTLIIAGHTHTYAYYASEKLVVVGNGGAPLSGTVDYGYVIARQSGSSIVFNEYDYMTNAVTNTFTVQ